MAWSQVHLSLQLNMLILRVLLMLLLILRVLFDLFSPIVGTVDREFTSHWCFLGLPYATSFSCLLRESFLWVHSFCHLIKIILNSCDVIFCLFIQENLVLILNSIIINKVGIICCSLLSFCPLMISAKKPDGDGYSTVEIPNQKLLCVFSYTQAQNFIPSRI